MRCSTSVTERSGSLPMSSATIESTISSEFRLMRYADSSAARWPLMTTTWASPCCTGCAVLPAGAGEDAAAAGAGVVWAMARPVQHRATCAAAMDNAVF
jgi:hypothetical protein